MENQNKEMLEAQEKADLLQKRKESKKFLKVYMFSFFSVVIVLISLSYFAQEKLNNQIESLTLEANTNRQDAITHMNSAESLQKLLSEQENLIKQQSEAIENITTQIEELEISLEAQSQENILYRDFLIMEQYYDDQNFSGCFPLLLDFYDSDGFKNAEKNILNGDDDALIYTNIVVKTYEIATQMLENEEILQQLTAEQIDQLKNLQNKG